MTTDPQSRLTPTLVWLALGALNALLAVTNPIGAQWSRAMSVGAVGFAIASALNEMKEPRP